MEVERGSRTLRWAAPTLAVAAVACGESACPLASSAPERVGAEPRVTAAAPLELPACLTPWAPCLAQLPPGALLAFGGPRGPLEVGTHPAPDATAPEGWREANPVRLPESDAVTVFARVADPSCEAPWFRHRYRLTTSFPGPPETADSTAIPHDDPRISAWAAAVEELVFGPECTVDAHRDPSLALGPAAGNTVDTLCLGEGGALTLRFEPPLSDGPGPDLAVFENAFSDSFLELAFVEVSSDGAHFVRFDTVYLGTQPLDAFGTQDTTRFDGLAGKYRQGYGTPFDLATLRARPEVQLGVLELSRVTHVRLVDIVGDGTMTDSFGSPIFDPTPTVGTAGFDVDAVAGLHALAP